MLQYLFDGKRILAIDETWFDGLTDDQVETLVTEIKKIPSHADG